MRARKWLHYLPQWTLPDVLNFISLLLRSAFIAKRFKITVQILYAEILHLKTIEIVVRKNRKDYGVLT